MEEKVKLINGGLAVDDRGELAFVNDFDFEGVKRFYMVFNHSKNFVRAWHGHRKEAKYVSVVSGTAIVGCIKVDNWDNPSHNIKPERFVLSAKKPQILYIPPGYANGFKTLTADTKIIFYSTATLEESMNDDIRFHAGYWNIWDIEER